MGSDVSVVRAARVSFAKDVSEFTDKDERLIQYLAKHRHELPFAHTAITLRMKAPIPIRTQCFKHKVGFVENEESRRYIKATPELYVPEWWREAPTGGAKQGSGGLHQDQAWTSSYLHVCLQAISTYERMIKDGVSPEQARFILPQGCYTNWIWTGSLLAFSRFYNMRTDPHAQKEVQELAVAVGSIIEPLFPVSWKALTNG